MSMNFHHLSVSNLPLTAWGGSLKGTCISVPESVGRMRLPRFICCFTSYSGIFPWQTRRHLKAKWHKLWPMHGAYSITSDYPVNAYRNTETPFQFISASSVTFTSNAWRRRHRLCTSAVPRGAGIENRTGTIRLQRLFDHGTGTTRWRLDHGTGTSWLQWRLNHGTGTTSLQRRLGHDWNKIE